MLLAFGLCIMLMNLFAGDRGLPAMWKSRQQAQLIARDIAALRAENATLRGRAQALREDARTIELVARETLGLTRPGEIVVLRGSAH
jgi:cell division protein FtsB